MGHSIDQVIDSFSKLSVRPTFKTHDKKPIRAGGVIFERKGSDGMEYLLQRRKGIWSDFGGKTDKQDHDIMDTISRELDEETNHMIELDKGKIIEELYIGPCKYLLVRSSQTIDLDPKDMGVRESHTDQARTVSWVTASKLKGSKVHCRLKSWIDKL